MSLWDDLRFHRADTAGRPILDLFRSGERARDFSIRADGMLFDYSKTAIDAHARDAGATTVRPAIRLDAAAADWPIAAADAVFCCNLAHIAPWAATEGLLAGAARLLPPGGPLVLYGPFRRHGRHTAASNAAFEASLQARDPAWRIRCVDNELVPAAARHGLVLDEVAELPANNLVLVWRRESLSAA